MSFDRKKSSFHTLRLYFNLISKWGKSQKKNFLIANFLMILVAATTSMYPIVIDFAFNAINNKDMSHILYIPLGIIVLTVIKGLTYFYQTIFVGKITNGIIKNIQLNLYKNLLIAI